MPPGAPSESSNVVKKPILNFNSVAVLVLLASLLVSLALLAHLSGPKHRFVSPQGIVPVIYVHAPAAIALFVGWLWQSLDADVRKHMPWASMCRSDGVPAKACESVLLDYASSPLPVTMYRALRNRHWPVVLSSLGIGVCGVTSIISAYLLSLEPIETSSREDFVVTSSFNSSLSTSSNISSDFLYAFLSQRVLNGSAPSRVVADKWLVETTKSVNVKALRYTANVTGWIAELNCHAGIITYNGSVNTDGSGVSACSYPNIMISSDGCSALYNPAQEGLSSCLIENHTR
jgi:hypothetical protein